MFTREQLITIGSIALVMAIRKYREYQNFLELMRICMRKLSKDE